MATKKTASNGIVSALHINAKKKRKAPSGKPFEKGNTVGFKPGQSGNPAGRPKARTLSEELRARLEEQYPGRPHATYGRMVAEKLFDLAVAGEMAAIKEIFDRLEGRPRQAIDVTVEEQKRTAVENAIQALMSETGVERDAAIEELARLTPEIKQWVN